MGLTAEKSMPLYTPEAFRFKYDVVYTNVQASGAYRGYGATQGLSLIHIWRGSILHTRKN